MAVDCADVNRARTFGLILLVATGVMLWITTRVSGYERQVLAALVTIGLAAAAVVSLFQSLEEYE